MKIMKYDLSQIENAIAKQPDFKTFVSECEDLGFTVVDKGNTTDFGAWYYRFFYGIGYVSIGVNKEGRVLCYMRQYILTTRIKQASEWPVPISEENGWIPFSNNRMVRMMHGYILYVLGTEIVMANHIID